MDVLSLLIFFIYTLVVLLVLVFVSPLISAVAMLLVPLLSVYVLPSQSSQFFSIKQFSFAGVDVHNIHLLLLIWSALIAVIVYTEIISWYLLRERKPAWIKKPAAQVAATASPKPDEPPKPLKIRVEDFLLKLGKLMSGKK
ncbi:hypothetical protein ig2599ANME_1399 [groundwater metagenome]